MGRNSGNRADATRRAGGGRELRELDQSISDDVGNLLDGQFDSVEAVLEGLLEEVTGAAARTGPASEGVEPAPREPARTSRPLETATVSTPIAASHLVEEDSGPEQADDEAEETGAAVDPHVPGLIERRLLALAGALSQPLRFVPEQWRLVVDVVAITIALWVPIVWIVVLFVV